MMEGLRKPDNGSIEICGIDALNKPEKIKEIIGAQLQSATIYDQIRVKKSLIFLVNTIKNHLPLLSFWRKFL